MKKVLMVLLVALCDVASAEEPPSEEFLWSDYYDQTSQRAPWSLLVETLKLFEAEERPVLRATDAGCGAGIETLFLSHRGVEVFAFDAEPDGIRRLRAALGPEHRKLVHLEVAPFHEAKWGEDVDLVVARLALPFSHPDHFPEAWSRLQDALSPGGRFVGHFFGDRDDWATLADRTHHSRSEVEDLLAEFEVEVLREVERDRKIVSGEMKHWHYFEIVAKKKSGSK